MIPSIKDVAVRAAELDISYGVYVASEQYQRDLIDGYYCTALPSTIKKKLHIPTKDKSKFNRNDGGFYD